MPEFDKYAPYVWWAYGVAGTIITLLIVWSVSRIREAKRKLDEIDGAGGRR